MATTGEVNEEKTAMPTPTAPSALGDTEIQTPGAGVSNIMRRWRRREDLLKKSYMASRGCGLFFSALAFIIMASNIHGDWMNLDRYEEYRLHPRTIQIREHPHILKNGNVQIQFLRISSRKYV